MLSKKFTEILNLISFKHMERYKLLFGEVLMVVIFIPIKKLIIIVEN